MKPKRCTLNAEYTLVTHLRAIVIIVSIRPSFIHIKNFFLLLQFSFNSVFPMFTSKMKDVFRCLQVYHRVQMKKNYTINHYFICLVHCHRQGNIRRNDFMRSPYYTTDITNFGKILTAD